VPGVEAQGEKSSPLLGRWPLKVGFIAPFSGAAQIYGESARAGFDSALAEINSPFLSVSYEDDQFTTSKTVAAFHKLVEQDGVSVVISVGSTQSNAVAPLAQQKRIPLIAWASDARVSRGRSYVVRAYPSGATEGAAVAKEALRGGYDAVGSIVSINDYSDSVREGFVRAFGTARLRLNEEVPPDLKDFRSIIVKARAAGVKQYFLCLNPGQHASFARQLRTLGVSDPIFGCENLYDPGEIKLSDGTLHGAWFVNINIESGLLESQKRRCGGSCILSGVAALYDAAYLLADAQQRSSSAEGLLKALLSSTRQNRILGSYGVTSADGDRYMDARFLPARIIPGGYERIAE